MTTIKVSRLINTILFIALSIFWLTSCEFPGSASQFKEMGVEEISENNVPNGMELRDGNLYPDEGYELVLSKDSTRVMLISTGSGKGQTEVRCECQEGLGLTCLPMQDIIGCSRLLCAKCKPILRVYERPIKFNRMEW